ADPSAVCGVGAALCQTDRTVSQSGPFPLPFLIPTSYRSLQPGERLQQESGGDLAAEADLARRRMLPVDPDRDVRRGRDGGATAGQGHADTVAAVRIRLHQIAQIPDEYSLEDRAVTGALDREAALAVPVQRRAGRPPGPLEVGTVAGQLPQLDLSADDRALVVGPDGAVDAPALVGVGAVPDGTDGRPELTDERTGVRDGDLVRPQQRDAHPGHVVVVAVDDPAAVAAHDARDVCADAVTQLGRARPGGGVDRDLERVGLGPVVPLQPDREPASPGTALVDAEPGVPEPVGEHPLRGVRRLRPAHDVAPGRVTSEPRPTTTRAMLRSDSEPGS